MTSNAIRQSRYRARLRAQKISVLIKEKQKLTRRIQRLVNNSKEKK